MTLRELLIGIAIGSFALAALAMGFAIRVVVRRAQAGKPWLWGGLFMRAIVITALLWSGVASLVNVPPSPDQVNRPAPAPSALVISLVSGPTGSRGTPIEGVSARDGVRRWTWMAPGKVLALFTGSDGLGYVVAGAGVGGPDTLVAVRLADGIPIWSHNGLDVTDNGSVALDGGRLYILLTAPGNTDDVAALDAKTGAVIWGVSAPAEITSQVSLTTTDGMVIIAGCPDASFSQWRMVVMRETTGAVAWKATSGLPPHDQATFGGVPTVAVSRDVVFVVEQLGASVVALDARNGALLWRKKWASPISNQTAYVEEAASSDALYTLVEGDQALEGLTALDARTGSVRWSAKLDIGATVTLQVSGDTLLASDYSGYLLVLNPDTGAQLWSYNNYVGHSALWLASGVMYLETREADPNLLDWVSCRLACSAKVIWLNAINARTGATWWRTRLGPVVRIRSS